ncbi:MAG: hypothetical protein ACREFE_04270 [Limisphaerales bacterium]
MSRPQKIIPPIKGSFTQIINAIAGGKGVKKLTRNQLSEKMAHLSAPKKKP